MMAAYLEGQEAVWCRTGACLASALMGGLIGAHTQKAVKGVSGNGRSPNRTTPQNPTPPLRVAECQFLAIGHYK